MSSPDEAAVQEVSELIARLNEAWLEGRPQDLGPLFDESIVMVLPGFAGRVEGREAMVAGFQDVCENAKVLRFTVRDRQVDVRGDTAVVSFAFEMKYERTGATYQSTGRDLWVLRRDAEEWRAMWRTMVDVDEEQVAG